jgi:Cu+-exporting ATPase
MTRTRLSIDGMHCASCVARVEKAIRQVPGVREASVNLATHSADIEHDEAEGSADQLTEAIKRSGYDAEVEQNQTRSASHDHTHHHQQANPSWHKYLALLAVPVVALGMGWMTNTSAWIQLALATPIQLLMGWPFYKRSLKGLRHGRADMDSLVALGTTVAFVYSAVITVRGGHAVYFDSAVVILVLISLGKVLESRATAAAGSAIGELMSLQPGEALRVEAGNEVKVPIDEVRVGDTLIVKPGASVPVDGQVTDGKSSIDQSLVTGESMPVEIAPGSEVFAGTVNQTGSFRMEATETGEGMLLSQITDAVRTAQASKANIQRLADKVAGVFVPAVLIVALGTLLGWGLSGYSWVFAMTAMVAVLIVACPCALGLATPTAIMVGSGLGAKEGILIKDAAAFERAGKLTHILFDKTGTLTKGRPAVTGVHPLDDEHDRATILRLAAAVEAKSEHPLAQAIVRAAEQENVEPASASEFEALTAGGGGGGAVRGRVEGKVVIVGRVQTLKDESVELGDSFEAKRKELFEQGQTAAAVAIDNRAVALIGFADELRDEAPDAIAALQALGLETVMVTGDHQAVADAIAQRAGIDRVYADCRPDDKHEVIAGLRRDGHPVAMVGDGINDAPALAAADLGIAVGGGTDIAKEAGHIVLVGEDLMNVPRAVRLSRATMRRIWIGLGWAFAYNVLLIPVAVAGLLHPMLAGAAMAASSVSVVGNALWLRRAWKREG